MSSPTSMRRLRIAAPLCVALAAAVPAATAAPAPSPAPQTYLKASNTGSADGFGAAVALSGHTLVIGAPGEASTATGVDGDQGSNGAPSAGAAYVFVRTGAGWVQQAYLKASNTAAGDQFGTSVAIAGDTIVVGAIGEDSGATGVAGNQADDGAPSAGAAYVFVRSGSTWAQQAYLKASNTDAGDEFGGRVALAGDTIVVGAIFEDSAATGVNGDESDDSASAAGAAYVFTRSGTTWSQQAYLKASNTGTGSPFNDNLGASIAISGDTVVIGADAEDSAATGVNGNQFDDSAPSSGAAYVYVRSGTTWSQQAYLKASNTDAGDQFGEWVAASGDTLVVGAGTEDSAATGVGGAQADDSAPNAGAVYVFTRAGTVWTQQAYIKATNAGADDRYGRNVALSGEALVVGAFQEDSGATGLGGPQADESAPNAGAAYVLTRSGATWSPQAYVKATNTEADDWFGLALSVSGDFAVVGAMEEDGSATGVGGGQGNGAPGAGAAYAYDLGLDAWTELGLGLAGSAGVPLLAGSGPLAPSSSNALVLSGALPSSPATLVVGLSQINAPFKGGTFVPAPLLLVPLATNPAGALTLPFTWPTGVPAGASLYFQMWISDSGALAGFAASNGLKGTTD